MGREIDYKKSDGLVPVIVQDANTGVVLMQGYGNEESMKVTRDSGKVTFYSRSKGRLWTKGETSNNFLMVKEILVDCDGDSVLIKANPVGPACHTGDDTCFSEENIPHVGFVRTLENIIDERKNNPADSSYTSSLFKKGINKIAQKVGEEAVETVIEAKDDNDDLFLNESADLLYHYLILLQAKGFKLADIEKVLFDRNQKKAWNSGKKAFR